MPLHPGQVYCGGALVTTHLPAAVHTPATGSDWHKSLFIFVSQVTLALAKHAPPEQMPTGHSLEPVEAQDAPLAEPVS